MVSWTSITWIIHKDSISSKIILYNQAVKTLVTTDTSNVADVA